MQAEDGEPSRARTFAARLAVERTILQKVNQYSDFPELMGLTKSAITEWMHRCEQAGYNGMETVGRNLMAIARATGTITDQSAQIVTDRKEMDPILIEKLEASLNSTSQNR